MSTGTIIELVIGAGLLIGLVIAYIYVSKKKD